MALQPTGRWDWERILRRLLIPWDVKAAGLLLATWADADGSRVRPGIEILTVSSGRSERTMRRLLRKLRDLGLIEVTSRGGGRGGKGRTTEYRLTIPEDLVERVAVLGVDYGPGAMGIWLAPPDDSAATQTTGESPVDNADSPVTQGTGQSEDGSDSEVTQVAGESTSDAPNDRPDPVADSGMTGHHGSIERPPRWPTTRTDQPPTTPEHSRLASTVTPPTREATAADATPDFSHVELKPARCPHGLKNRIREDGSPACFACRRQLDAKESA